jgi:hypothetical protein
MLAVVRPLMAKKEGGGKKKKKEADYRRGKQKRVCSLALSFLKMTEA